MHPLASAIDTPLPTPPEVVENVRKDAPAWTLAASLGGGVGRIAQQHAYPAQSLADWHARHKLSGA